jgi:hypothetical protein
MIEHIAVLRGQVRMKLDVSTALSEGEQTLNTLLRALKRIKEVFPTLGKSPINMFYERTLVVRF